mmetsp:Transcript_9185/g.12376  ORF Transcript_9185/g.12376 Transcript_9185/m.12376 type:complete len:311 (-) Transcript_9185:41-973(-)|eukprot:CAMPEP_0201490486 /NCGR_PEP_ID=MMETSP0151_2-20130828/26580_1 /ASSEMBLY_ACC=CAM_ASM_000257 /TAXON_ID=200890 /ORGANISM="Paramoeba atlantica, Strain 621/1 / CCAP 1560/9" /LENGTH=310 /DNA_ID=CAMNT_0047876459 /DNA_START=202 /DNA_END=1134 /DNA_ORIENTATION=+
MGVGGPRIHLAFHLVFSLLLLIEGMTRTSIAIGQGYFGEGGWTGLPDQFPPVVLLLAAIAEVIFALAGIIHSLLGLLFDKVSELGTKFVIALEIALGWFTISIWVIANNAFVAYRDTLQIEGYSSDDVDAVIIIGIFGGIAYCGALQGSQVYFANSVLADIKGEDRSTPGFLTGRYVWYCLLYFIGSVAQLTMGAFVEAHPTEQNIFMLPFIVVWPGISLAVGLFATWTAIIGFSRIPLGPFGGPMTFSFLMLVSWILHLSLSLLTQIGTNAPPPTFVFPVSPLTGLTAALHFMPAYLDNQIAKAKSGED